MGTPAQMQTRATPLAVVNRAAMKAKHRIGMDADLDLQPASTAETYGVNPEVSLNAATGKLSPRDCTTEQLFEIVIDVARRFRNAKEVVAEHREYILRLKTEVFKVRSGSAGARVLVRCKTKWGRTAGRKMTWKEFCETQFGVSADWINRICGGKAEATGNAAAVEKPTNGGSGPGWNTILTNLVNALEPCSDSLPLPAKDALEAARELLEGEADAVATCARSALFRTAEGERGERDSVGKYWLTPRDVYAALDDEFNFDYDPCPCPRPKGFDGLAVPWGACSYVNPPFTTVAEAGRKVGMTAWVRKAIEEQAKGNTSVLVYPQHGWVHMLVKAGAELRSLGKVDWVDIEDERSSRPASSPIMAFILRGLRDESRSYCDGGSRLDSMKND